MYKLIVTVPEKDADKLRDAMHEAGAGKIGNYTHCSFSVKGTGRFKGNENSDPAVGEKGKMEEVDEEKIETTVCEEDLSKVIEAIRKTHPYEEPIIDVYKLHDPLFPQG